MEIREVEASPGRRRFAGASGFVELLESGLDHTARIQLTEPEFAPWVALHDYALDVARLSGASRVVSVLREDDPDVDRLRGAGYRAGWRSWGASLELPDQPDWTPYDDLALAEVEVRELAPADAEAAYGTYCAAAGDFPQTPATLHDRLGPAEFAGLIVTDRVFGAFAQGRCLGLTVSRMDGATVDTRFTVTGPQWRGRGIAAMTKAVMIRTLHAEGARVFRTGGAEANLPMLAVNRRVGYRREPWWVTYVMAI